MKRKGEEITKQEELDLTGGPLPIRSKILVDLLRPFRGFFLAGGAHRAAHPCRWFFLSTEERTGTMHGALRNNRLIAALPCMTLVARTCGNRPHAVVLAYTH